MTQILLPAFQGLSDEAIMNRVGFQESFITAILAPDIPGMCESEVLKDRINDTLYLRWLSMLQVKRKLKAAGAMAVAKKKDGKRLELDTNASAGESSLQHPTITPPAGYTIESLGATLSAISEHELPERLLVVSEPILLPGHTMLYKGKYSAELVEPPSVSFLDDGRLAMDRLWSWKGGDFNHNELGHYWTPDKACAERYRTDAAARMPFAETWLIHIQVPDSFLQSLGVQNIWWGEDYRQFVWLNHRKLQTDLPFPTALQKYETANCVKGHVTFRNREVPNLKKEHVQTGFREQWLLVIDGRKQEQLCFKGNNVVLALSSQCQGKVHVEVHPPSIKIASQDD